MRYSTPPVRPAARAILLATLFALQGAAPGNRAEAAPPGPPAKAKLRGYITSRVDDATVAILDDRIQLSKGGHVEPLIPTPELRGVTFDGLKAGELIEAEGVWEGKHKFSADRISVEAGWLGKLVHETAYLQGEPDQAARIANGDPAELQVDGEWLVLGDKTRRGWPPPETLRAAKDDPPGAAAAPAVYAGRQVRYGGVRRDDGKIEADVVELADPAPPDAYDMHHGSIARGKDPQTGIDILEARRNDKVVSRMKLFPVPAVQQYVAELGTSLLPAGDLGTTRDLEFRFFVVEDPAVNAQSLPDGTVLVDTGLLGAVDSEAELAFVLSHEIAHVLQAHTWRETTETRPARVGLTIAGIAGSLYAGDTSIFLAQLGMAAVVNGHERSLENQADRLGIQTIIDRGYDPREATRFFRFVIERYGEDSTSKIWSNHESSVMRGSLLTVQMEREYPSGHFDGARANTPAFVAMHEALGPVKIE